MWDALLGSRVVQEAITDHGSGKGYLVRSTSYVCFSNGVCLQRFVNRMFNNEVSVVVQNMPVLRAPPGRCVPPGVGSRPLLTSML